MHYLSRTLAIVAFVVAGVLGVGVLVAFAQSTQSTQRTVSTPRAAAPAADVTAPPLPFGDQSRAAAGERRANVPGGADVLAAFARLPIAQRSAMSRLVPYTGPRPPIPKMSDLLNHKTRSRQSATGGTIVLTGTSSVPYLDDQTLSYGANVFWLCQNLKPSTQYRYLIFPPDGTAYTVQTHDYVANNNVATFSTDTSGRCSETSGGQQVPFYAELQLETPLTPLGNGPVTGIGPTRGGTCATACDAPYSGVWTIAVQNTATSAYEAVAYSVVLGTLNFATYSDAALSTRANDFTSGATIYVAANGLNPAHFYSFGFVNTSGNGLPCVYSIPTGSQNWNNGTCFTLGASGVLPTSQSFSGQYTTPAAGGNSLGTQSVQLFDATTNDLVSTQQVSLNPSAVVWSPIVPFNTVLGNGTNLGDTFATDGLLGTPGSATAEQSVTALNYNVSGLTSGHVYRITVSNANGVVLNSTTTDATPRFGSPQFFALPAQFTAAGTSSGNQQVPFPINATNFTSFGATQIPFAPNVYTAQLYDVTAAAVVGSKSFTVVSYAATFQWTNPPGSFVNTLPANAATPVTATMRNAAGTFYGNWNGDPIKAITIRSDSGNKVTLGLQGGITTAIDSVGQTWTLTRVSGTQINVLPQIAGQALPANATIAIPITVASATGSCTTACTLQTQITPLHGIAPSNFNAAMNNTASNGIDVFSSGVVGTNTEATYAFTVGSYSGAQLGTPRYTQMMYRSGTNGSPQGTYNPPSSFYPLTINVANSSAVTLTTIEFTLPATVDPNQQTPSITSATVNGATQTGQYKLLNQNGSNGATADATLGPNSFALQMTGAGQIGAGKSAVIVLRMPVLLTSFPFQEIAATANYKGTPLSMAPTNTLTNAIAGTQNIDSTELGVFTLDPTLMSATISPVVLPALPNQSWSFKFINTTSGLDPNPDYVSQLLVTVPAAGAGIFPTVQSVVASNGATFNANATGTQGQWLIDLCANSTVPVVLTQASTPCAAATDANALPPGGTLTVNFKYAGTPAVGTYKVNWIAVGANGGAVVAASGSQVPVLNVLNTTAQTSFAFAGGYSATPAFPPGPPIQAVPANSQPIVGSWSDFINGNAYVYELNNNGSTSITNVNLAIPSSDQSGQIFDVQDWAVIAASVHVYGSGAGGAQCNAGSVASVTQPVRGSPGTYGHILLAGCTGFAPGKKIDIFFNARSPYDTGHTFLFPASVTADGSTPADPSVAANVNTLPLYSLANTVRIVTDARLVIQLPTGAAGPYTPALQGEGGLANVSCPGCVFTTGGANPLINVNQISGSATLQDSLAASVYSDDTAGWALSVIADVNPGTSGGQLTTAVSPRSSVPSAGTFTKLVTVQTPVPTGSALNLSTWSGASNYHFPVDNLMTFGINLNPLSVNNNTNTTVTLTYTLIAN